MKILKWEQGRQGSNYRKFTILFSELLRCDAYILHIPAGSSIRPHFDCVPFMRHYRVNITLFGDIWMGVPSGIKGVFRVGRWFSFFRPDEVPHWVPPAKKNTYIFSFGWLRF